MGKPSLLTSPSSVTAKADSWTQASNRSCTCAWCLIGINQNSFPSAARVMEFVSAFVVVAWLDERAVPGCILSSLDAPETPQQAPAQVGMDQLETRGNSQLPPGTGQITAAGDSAGGTSDMY